MPVSALFRWAVVLFAAPLLMAPASSSRSERARPASLLPPAGWTGDFGNEIRTGAGGGASAIAIAKFAHHTNADMVVVNSDDGTMGVYFGNGDGTFQTPTLYSAGDFPMAVAVGDVNGDGLPDIVVANYNIESLTLGNTVSVFLGNADGTFQPPVNYPVGNHPIAVVLANFDGQLDIVTADNADGTVSFLHGNGDGTFAPRVTFAAGTGPHSIAVADFNGDGNLDLAVADCTAGLSAANDMSAFDCTSPSGAANGTVSVLLGNGAGGFGSAISVPVPLAPYAVAAADLNQDGHPDLAVAHELLGGGVSVLLGKGDGTFGTPTVLPAGDYVNSVAIADFSGDGNLDIAAGNGNLVFVEILGNGDGTFQTPINYGWPDGGLGLVQADLTGAGKPDLILLDNTGVVGSYLNVSGTARSPTTLALAVSPSPALTTSGIALTSTLTATPLPTGTMSFAIDGVPIFSPPGAEVGSGSTVGGINTSGQSTAGFAPSPSGPAPLAAGTHTITAVYSGNNTTQASTASTSLVINLTPTSISLTGSPNPATVGTAVEFDACIYPPISFGGSGTVSFFDGTTLLATQPLAPGVVANCAPQDGQAAFTTSSLTVGTHAITASYSGNAVYAASTSTVVNEVIVASDTSGGGGGGGGSGGGGGGSLDAGALLALAGIAAARLRRRSDGDRSKSKSRAAARARSISSNVSLTSRQERV